MAITRDDAMQYVQGLLDHFDPGRWQELYAGSGIYLTSDGMIYGCTDRSVKIGFGIRHSLTPSGELLAEIGDQCARNVVGHLWMCQGADNDHWSVIWGVKLMLGWCETDSFRQGLMDCHGNHQALVEMIDSKISVYGGEPYWPVAVEPGVELGARGLILAGHVLG